MSYTNLIGRSPINLSDDIQIFSGALTTSETISDYFRDTVGVEPGVGTLYISSGGVILQHHKAGTGASDWSLITDVQGIDYETYSVGFTLGASMLILLNK